jgi:prophage antirepressor-like protein
MMSQVSEPTGNDVANLFFDAINKSFTYGNTDIRTIIINDEVWFCGKDVANILEYKDLDQALRKNVRERNKMYLHDLLKKIHPATLVGVDQKVVS